MTIDTTKLMNFPEIYSATGMMELIQKIGFLPLLDSGIEGFSAEDIVADDCGYVRLPEGGWDWSLLNTPEDLYGRLANAIVLPWNLTRGFSSI